MIDTATANLLRRALEAVAEGKPTALRTCVDAIGTALEQSPAPPLRVATETPRELLPLSLPQRVGSCETRHVHAVVHAGPFFPERLFVAPSIARFFAIEDITIGKESLALGPGAQPASFYANVRTRGARLTRAQTMPTGMLVRVIVTNVGLRPHPWLACILGVGAPVTGLSR